MNLPRVLLAVFISCFLWMVISQYFFCPRFYFKAPQPFSGRELYNPYDSIGSENWIKCNFHAHTNAWNGLTDGRGTASDIHRAYDSLGYDVYCLSEYQKINKGLENVSCYIPAYEHGYGIKKTHQTVLGAERVCWTDYFLPQALNNKQHILNRLSSDSENTVIINHPANRNGYECSDFKHLTNYHCMEVLNPSAISLAHWDSALSFGKPVFVVGNDDVHNVLSGKRLGSMCTWVNVSSIKKENVLHSLRTGKSYGMIVGNSPETLPALKKFDVTNDTITIEMSKEASQIAFVGQNGQVLTSCSDTSSAQYVFKPSDHYARAQIAYENGTNIYLNPVFRYEKSPLTQPAVTVNFTKTFAFRLLGAGILIVWMLMAFSFVHAGKWWKIAGTPALISRKLFGRLQNVFHKNSQLQS